MANLVLASKRTFKSGEFWHVYRSENGNKSEEFFFSAPLKALRYAFILRTRHGAIIPKGVYNKLMAGVKESKTQAEQEPSAMAKAFEQMKTKHPDTILLFRMGDFYGSFADDAKTLSEVLGITITRTSAKDITARQAAFPANALDMYLPKLVRAGKRVAICDEPTKVVEKVEPAKKATRKSAKSESK